MRHKYTSFMNWNTQPVSVFAVIDYCDVIKISIRGEPFCIIFSGGRENVGTAAGNCHFLWGNSNIVLIKIL